MKIFKIKKIAFFLPGLYGGGAERIMLNIAAGFAEKNFSVDLVLAEAVGPYLSEVPKSIHVVELSSRRLKAFRTIACLPALVKYLQIEQPQVILSAVHANVVALWAKLIDRNKPRVILSEHNTFSVHNQQQKLFNRFIVFLLVKHFYPLADNIIAVSKGVADDLAAEIRLPPERIKVIYNPVITREVQDKIKKRINHPWFNCSKIPVVLAMGRLTAQKDFKTLISSFAVVRQNLEARLLILGEGEKRHELELMVKHYNLQQDVSLPGFVSNPYPYLAHASLFVLSSRWEGLPTVLVEALFCGIPIVATDCPSGPREILNNGLYGDLVPVGSVTTMAKLIEKRLKNSRNPNPDESWLPYENETVVNQYIQTLLGR